MKCGMEGGGCFFLLFCRLFCTNSTHSTNSSSSTWWGSRDRQLRNAPRPTSWRPTNFKKIIIIKKKLRRPNPFRFIHSIGSSRFHRNEFHFLRAWRRRSNKLNMPISNICIRSIRFIRDRSRLIGWARRLRHVDWLVRRGKSNGLSRSIGFDVDFLKRVERFPSE